MQLVELVCRSVGCLLHIWSLEHGRLACQHMSVGRLIDPALKQSLASVDAWLGSLHARLACACMQSVGCLLHIWSLDHGRLACACLHAVYVGRSVDRSCVKRSRLQSLTIGLCLYLWSLEHARLACALHAVGRACMLVGRLHALATKMGHSSCLNSMFY